MRPAKNSSSFLIFYIQTNSNLLILFNFVTVWLDNWSFCYQQFSIEAFVLKYTSCSVCRKYGIILTLSVTNKILIFESTEILKHCWRESKMGLWETERCLSKTTFSLLLIFSIIQNLNKSTRTVSDKICLALCKFFLVGTS